MVIAEDIATKRVCVASMTDAELDELERLADAARPRPWFTHEEKELFVADVEKFCASAYANIKALIAEVRRLRVEKFNHAEGLPKSVINAYQAVERERCAKIAEGWLVSPGDTAWEIAAKIRGGGGNE